MIKFRTIAALALATAVAACSSSGTQVTADQMAQFQKGKSTYSDVVGKLGDPSQTSIDDNGNKTITYMYQQTDVKAQTFIPVVGLFSNGANIKNSTATFTFNPAGTLIKKSQSQGATDYNGGVGH